MRNKEERVIQAFAAHLAKNGHRGLKVDRWPDRDKTTPANERIDAVAGDFAIEHTSVDALNDKRARDPQCMQALGELETVLVLSIVGSLQTAPAHWKPPCVC